MERCVFEFFVGEKDVLTIGFIILSILFLGMCVLDFMELRRWWWEVITDNTEDSDDKESESRNNPV